MINAEIDIYNLIATRLYSEFPGISVSSELVLEPSKFPSVSIEEADNFTLRSSQDSSNNENHATLMYEVNAFSNKPNGRKIECVSIFSTLDEEFLKMGFTRTMKRPFSMNTSTSYRLIGRYTANISKDKVVYRR